MIKFFEPVIGDQEIELVNKTIKSGWISSQGKIVEKFEKNFSKWHGMKYAVSCSNCTTALHLSLLSLDIKKGDEVICSNLTFIAPANMIKLSGAKLVLVDVNPRTFCMDIDQIKKKITKRTKAIMIIHPFGYPVDIKKIKNIIQHKNIKIIEDVAESIGASVGKDLCGTLGDVSCFSFFANKIMTTGEGGMLLTNNKNIFNKARLLRDHGMSVEKKYYHRFLAFNYRMTSMQAALGIAQLSKLKKILYRKEKLYNFYKKNLLSINFDVHPKLINKNSVNWFVTITFNKKNLRNKFINYMKSKNVECRPMIFPVSFADHFKKHFNKYEYPNSYNISLNSVHLPSSIGLRNYQLKKICNFINKWDQII